MSDYSFMRSGFGGESNTDDNFEENIQALLVAFAENALKTAAIYVSHCGRSGITSEDLKRSLMIELFLFTQRPDIVQQIESIKQEINNMDEQELPAQPTFQEEFRQSACNCQVCTCMNNIYSEWNSFSPSSQIEQIIHNHINNI